MEKEARINSVVLHYTLRYYEEPNDFWNIYRHRNRLGVHVCTDIHTYLHLVPSLVQRTRTNITLVAMRKMVLRLSFLNIIVWEKEPGFLEEIADSGLDRKHVRCSVHRKGLETTTSLIIMSTSRLWFPYTISH